MNHTIRRGAAALAVAGASLAGTLALAGPAGAKAKCQTTPKSSSEPSFVKPCNGAHYSAKQSITFTVKDDNPAAGHQATYLDIGRRVSHGHVGLFQEPGVYARMKPVKGHRGRFTLVVKVGDGAHDWQPKAGTYHAQVRQLTHATSSGIVYGTVLTFHIS